MERGEVDGYPSVFYSALTSTRPTWLPEKKVKLLVQVGLEKEPNLPDVPSALDLARNADDKVADRGRRRRRSAPAGRS